MEHSEEQLFSCSKVLRLLDNLAATFYLTSIRLEEIWAKSCSRPSFAKGSMFLGNTQDNISTQDLQDEIQLLTLIWLHSTILHCLLSMVPHHCHPKSHTLLKRQATILYLRGAFSYLLTVLCLRCPSTHISKILQGKIKLVVVCRFSPWWLALMVSEGAVQAASRGKSLIILPRCKSSKL